MGHGGESNRHRHDNLYCLHTQCLGHYHGSKTVAQPPPRAPSQQSRHGPAMRPSQLCISSEPDVPRPRAVAPRNVPFPLATTYLLWGVTFCSILTTGNRRCTQPRQVRVASVPLTARSSITREVGGAAALAFQATTPPVGRHESSLLRCFTESSRQLGALRGRRTARKWRRPQQRRASEGRRTLPNPRKAPRSQTPSSILLAVGLQRSPLPAGTVRGGQGPVSISMEADEHGKWFREPPPPSLKSS